MCVSPVRIPNPNYGNKLPLMRQMYDCESQFLNVPCNVCSECIAARQMHIVQRARTMALDHYIFYCTLTYNNESLPVYTCSNGYSIRYADISDIQRMFKRIRKSNAFGRPFSYFFVTERGSERARPHVHGLIFIRKNDDDDKLFPAQLEPSVSNTIFKEWRRNYGSNRKPIWRPLFTFRRKYVAGKLHTNFDCHYVTPHSSEHGASDVAFYVTKYILKPSDKEERLQRALKLNLSPEEFESVWKVVRSRCICSKHFGASTDFERNYVRDSIHVSRNDPEGFKYYTEDGKPQPLARYYRRYVGLDDAVSSSVARGSPLTVDNRSQSEKDLSVERGKIIKSKVSHREISELFPL